VGDNIYRLTDRFKKLFLKNLRMVAIIIACIMAFITPIGLIMMLTSPIIGVPIIIVWVIIVAVALQTAIDCEYS
jgi:uncharacterized membrane protein YkvI